MTCLNKVESMLLNEMQIIADQGVMDAGTLDVIWKMSTAIKNIKKIKWMNEQNTEDSGREEMLAEINELMDSFKAKYGDIK